MYLRQKRSRVRSTDYYPLVNILGYFGICLLNRFVTHIRWGSGTTYISSAILWYVAKQEPRVVKADPSLDEMGLLACLQ